MTKVNFPTQFTTIQNTTNTKEFADEVSAFFETHTVIYFQVTPESSEQYEKIHIQHEAE
tara:strand:- start:179 stop:355 length:177 start_codon:yes stop_codon:yes gene_type:complete